MNKLIKKITRYFYLKYLRDNKLEERHNIFNVDRKQGMFTLDVEDTAEQIVVVDGVITLYTAGDIYFNCGYIADNFRDNSLKIKGIKVLNTSLRPLTINLKTKEN